MSTLLLALLVVSVAGLSWYCLGPLQRYLKRQQFLDVPNERSMHAESVPRGGGLVIVAVLLLTLGLVGVLTDRYAVFFGLLSLVSAWAYLSWRDDRADLSPKLRLLFHIVFAIFTVLAFGYVTEVQLSKQTSLYLGVGGAVISVIGVLWFTNLYNFMDGMDGLAASQTIVAGITMSFWFWQAGDPHLGLVCLMLAAASYGFLLRNWHPASIFMGDVGSITIGAFYSILIIVGNNRYQIPVLSFVLLFSVFIADASLTILKRLIKGEKIWLAHRQHYYQRLGLAGVSHAKIVISMVVLMLLSAMIASFTVLDHDRITTGLVLIVALVCLAIIWVNQVEKKKMS